MYHIILYMCVLTNVLCFILKKSTFFTSDHVFKDKLYTVNFSVTEDSNYIPPYIGVEYTSEDIKKEEEEIKDFFEVNSFGRKRDKVPRAHPLYKFLKYERKQVIKLERFHKNRNAELRKQEWRDFFQSVKDGTDKPIFTKEQQSLWQQLLTKFAEISEPLLKELELIESNGDLEIEDKYRLSEKVREQIQSLQNDVFDTYEKEFEETGALKAAQDCIIPRYVWDLSQRDPRHSIFKLPENCEIPYKHMWESTVHGGGLKEGEEVLKLHKLPSLGEKTKKRLGRGHGSGKGGSSGRGCKGQKHRSGKYVNPMFEGGQTPLYRRIPKFVGRPLGHGVRYKRCKYELIPLSELNRAPDGATVDWAYLERIGAKLGRYKLDYPIKVVGDKRAHGEKKTEITSKNLIVKVWNTESHSAHAFTKSAAKAIMDAGGKCLLLRPRTHDIVQEEYDPRIPRAKRYIFSGKISRHERKRREIIKSLKETPTPKIIES
ncbi:ribosomal protein L15, putative [Theileria annulata]|uniref:Ribosomal protein L15, putative n=1 Tax=Theileria annulata TaxID=5874 RepID=Q4UD43_THEAN|nr:ribosomal protein L15, putative [Theileria annulata]CAI75258.1 ribosomal protein L15, putative [Theileria annulata]|eukprot:XP_954734.1 ribosomal protein L15, putative [Theileria annulata]